MGSPMGAPWAPPCPPHGESLINEARTKMVCVDAGGWQTCRSRAHGRGPCPQEAMGESSKEQLAVLQEKVSAVAETTVQETEEIERSDNLISGLQLAIESLRELGALAPAVALENEIRKEERRRRAICKENPAVMEAMRLQREYEARQEIERARMLKDANAKLLADRKRELEDVEKKVRKRKAEIADMESLAATRSAVKRYSPEHLGQASRSGGGAACRKTRFEVLDRIAKLGAGLSTPQKNDWQWFKESWDAAMLEEHKADWGGKFASWVQGVLNSMDEGVNNAFSLFVNAETRRVLDKAPALMVPGLG